MLARLKVGIMKVNYSPFEAETVWNDCEPAANDNSPVAKIARLAEKAKAQKKGNSNTLNLNQPQQVSIIGSWPKDKRGCANMLLRSSLFTVRGRGKRRYFTNHKIVAPKNAKISYTGPELDQNDLDLLMVLINALKSRPANDVIITSGADLIKEQNLTDSGANRAIMWATLERLVGVILNIRTEKYRYAGALLASVAHAKSEQKYRIKMNPEIAGLLATGTTWLDWSVRQELRGQPLAQWLHGYYSTHAKPYGIKVKTIQGLCGSRISETRDFKKSLIKSLERLSSVYASRGQLFKFSIENNLISIEKNAR